MTYYEVTTCRLAIQVCIGYGSNGKARHRTFSMKNIRSGASDEGIAAVIRALAPLLIYPITKVHMITKRKIFFVDDAAPAAPAVALPVFVPLEDEIESDTVAELVEPLDSLDIEIALWEERKAREEQEKFALALIYMLWVWKMLQQNLLCKTCVSRNVYTRSGLGCIRAPPARLIF